jgi:hypothetical protein
MADDEHPVFPAANGSLLMPNNVFRRVLQPARDAAELPWVGFHAFRHTCASILFAEGRNAVQVQRENEVFALPTDRIRLNPTRRTRCPEHRSQGTYSGLYTEFMATTDRTVHVGPHTYALLRKEAERRHRDIDTTADDLLAERLSASTADAAKLERTLERAARLRARLPNTNVAVTSIREGRDELEQRAEHL